MSKSVKPSGVTARKARLTRLFRELDDEDRYFEIKLVKGNKVVFLFGGYEIDFILENGQITRGVAGYQFLTEQDWVFLTHTAEKLMLAALAGYRDKPPKKERRKKVPKFKSAPGQGILKF